MERDKLLGTMDAKVWTDEFMATKARLGDEEFDHAMMLAWFANAIMAGFDEATRRQQATIADLQGQLEVAQNKQTALEKSVRNLTEFYDKYNGTPCEQIRHQQEVELLQQRVAQLEGERADWKKAADDEPSAIYLGQLKFRRM